MPETTESFLVREAGGEKKYFFVHRPRRFESQAPLDIPEFSRLKRDNFSFFSAIKPPAERYMKSGEDIAEGSYFAPSPPNATPPHKIIPGLDICETCEDIDIANLFGRGNGRRYLMGDARAIVRCKRCALCRLITGGFQSTLGLSLAQTCDLPVEIHVILTSVHTVVPFVINTERQFELQAFFLDHESSSLGQASMRLVGEDAVKIGRSEAFKGRLIDPKAADISLARRWIRDCDNGHYPVHGLAPSTKRQSSPWKKWPSEQDDTFDGLLVIDTRERCLTELPPGSKLTTLSYTWPLFETLQLQKDNLDQLRAPGALSDDNKAISNVIRETMKVVEQLDERYVWIDALCITQDDPDVKSRLIARMNQIYGHAYLNIIVATSPEASSDYNIPGIGASRLSQQITEEIDGLKLVTALPDYNAAFEKSRWATRGWTFQEGVIAARCLVFTDDQMYFRCKSDFRCEDATCEGIMKGFDTHPARPKQRESKLDFLMTRDFETNVKEGRFSAEYAQLVREYTRRSLKFESDMLNAFTGVLNVFNDNLGFGFVFAIQSVCFERGLMWYPTQPGERRREYPSWSWLGWRGPVDFEHDIIKRKDAEASRPLAWWFIIVNHHMRHVRPDTPDSIARSTEQLARFSEPQLIQEPLSIFAHATIIRRRLRFPEEYIVSYVTDLDQTLPCFAILDREDRPCGFLPSADRDWAKSQPASPGLGIDFAILAESPLCKTDTLHDRARFFDEKYSLTSPSGRLCSVMLITYDSRGIASRRGVGKIHKDSVDFENTLDASQRILVLT